MEVAGFPSTEPAKNLRYRLCHSHDHAALRGIDSSFVTDRIYHIESKTLKLSASNTGFGFNLMEVQLESPLHKCFPDDDDGDGDEDDDSNPDDDRDRNGFTIVAEKVNSSSRPQTTAATANRVIGFITAKLSAWNSRLTIADIEIHPSYRGQGIGKALMNHAEKIACSRYQVKHMWLEVSNVNVPAIKSYLTMGFKMAGLDMSLYVGTKSEGEFAIFMWKDVGRMNDVAGGLIQTC